MKKHEGAIFIQIASAVVVFFAIFIGTYMIYTYMANAEKDIVDDAVVMSNLASLKKIDLAVYGADGNTLVINNHTGAFNSFKNKLKVNLSLDNNLFPTGPVHFISDQVVIEKFIIYNVVGNDITKVEVNPNTLATTSTSYPGTKGTLTTPKGNKIDSTTVHSQIALELKALYGNSLTVHQSNDNDITK